MPDGLKDSQVTLRLPNELKDSVQTYADLVHRSKSHVVMEAVREYLAWRTPQVEDLEAAVAAADAGDFAADDEVRAVFERYPLQPKPVRATAKAGPGAPKSKLTTGRPATATARRRA